jgi:MFS transporter, DHA2 family, glioxin efflux transporter
MDLLGTFTIMAAVVCYLLALQWGGVTKKWSDSTVIGTLIGFCLLAIAFVINEYIMSDRALLQGRLQNSA